MTEQLRALLVEDNKADVDLIRDMLSETEPAGFAMGTVSRLSEALSRLKDGPIDIVLLDLGLPDSIGLQTFRKLREAAPDIPIVVLTGNTDQQMAIAAVREGAQDYLVKGEINASLLTRSVRYAVERIRSQQKLKETLDKLQLSLRGIIQAVSRVMEMRDSYTAGHQRRVTALSRAIALEMGLAEDRVEGLCLAGEIHDLGKISVPAEILSKPTRLTEFEFRLIQNHPRAGYDILKEIDFPWPVAEIILQHHERMDGSGYPQGLRGADILLEARILAVADIVEAIASDRPYRAALGIGAALEELEQKKGIHYDLEVAKACLTLFREKGFALS
jgi:putative two-component system response regulator